MTHFQHRPFLGIFGRPENFGNEWTRPETETDDDEIPALECGEFNFTSGLRGVHYRPTSADALLLRNVAIYGLGGIVAPFIGIKIIDLLIAPLVGQL